MMNSNPANTQNAKDTYIHSIKCRKNKYCHLYYNSEKKTQKEKEREREREEIVLVAFLFAVVFHLIRTHIAGGACECECLRAIE